MKNYGEGVCEGKAHIYNIYRYNGEECKQTIGFHCAEQTERTKRATPRVTNKTKTF